MQTAAQCIAQKDVRSWHTLPTDKVFESLKATWNGLSAEEAEKRLDTCGRNILPKRKMLPLWQIFLHQFASPLIYVLMMAGLISLLIGHVTDAIFIFAVILFNAALGTYQEYQAEKSAQALQDLLKISAVAFRDDREIEIDAEELVPGDVVLLTAGSRVPSDIRLLEASDLSVDESLLTGESQPVDKTPAVLAEESRPVGDRINMAFAGSTITHGQGRGVVVATALQSEIGKISESVSKEIGGKTPLITRMEKFTKKLAWIALIAVVVLAMIAWMRGFPLDEVFVIAVALAVSAIPEGLPVAMTVALSIGSRRMSKRHVIVRKLMAVEGLGSCTCIASDKTGTLTLNRQTVKILALADGKRFQVSGESYTGDGEIQDDKEHPLPEVEFEAVKRIAKAAIISNDGSLFEEGDEWRHEGDPVDVALLGLGYKSGLNPDEVRQKIEMIGEIPYESERQFSAKFYRENHQVKVAIKGAGEKLLPLCKQTLMVDGDIRPVEFTELEREATRVAEEGFRVIAVAEGTLQANWDLKSPGEENLPELTLLGLIGLIDPLRPEARDAIQTCKKAGVRVVMITGDHPATALAIARQLDIGKDRQDVITGRELQKAGKTDDQEFQEQITSLSVFARIAPVQKLHIVEALRHSGHFVAVTGDGVNDTPALKAANIGVAMGSGSDIAKDTASIIITDDNFASIVAGMEEGRYAYDNVRKVILLLIPTGIAELLMVAISLSMGLPIALTAVQLLWLNMVTNGIQDIALAFEAGEKGAVKRPPRDPEQGIFDRLMIQESIVVALTMTTIGFGTWYWFLDSRRNEMEARNLLLLLMVLIENFHALNSRSEHQSAFKVPLRNNTILVLGILAAQGLHILAMYNPFLQDVLQVRPVTMMEWLLLLPLASSVLIAMEIFKYVKRRQTRKKEFMPSVSAIGAI